MPIVLRESKVGGPDDRTDKILTQKRVLDRRYVPPKKVKPEDVVLTDRPQEVEGPDGKKRQYQLSPKELTDPRVREELKLEPLLTADDEDDPKGARASEQDGEDLDDDDARPTGLEGFVSDWQTAVEMVKAAAEKQDTDALASYHEAEMARSKPRPSVVRAFVEAGLGDAKDFEK